MTYIKLKDTYKHPIIVENVFISSTIRQKQQVENFFVSSVIRGGGSHHDIANEKTNQKCTEYYTNEQKGWICDSL
jgi:hypothetical protein